MKNLLSLLALIGFLFSTSVASAQQTEGLFKKRKKDKPEDQNQTSPIDYRSKIYNYHYWYPQYVEQYLKLVEESTFTRSSNPEGDPACRPMISQALSKGVLDVRYALGYFDDSQGIDIVYDGVNYGLSPSLDIEIFYVLREAFTKKCEGDRRLCGFTESGDPVQGKLLLTKMMRLHGQDVRVQLTLTHASASYDFNKNKTELAARQNFLTLQSEDNYFNALGLADIVFYNGHSRDGGGPDFNPPILRESDLKVNYSGYYQVKKPGITRALQAIKNGPNKSSVVGFFSCYSQRHFYNSILKANPQQRLILSSDTINYLDSLQASVGYLEGLLRGQCGQTLADIAKQTDSVKVGFKGFQIR